jgi:hypothetical protein
MPACFTEVARQQIGDGGELVVRRHDVIVRVGRRALSARRPTRRKGHRQEASRDPGTATADDMDIPV